MSFRYIYPDGAKSTKTWPLLLYSTAAGDPTAAASLILLIPGEMAVVLDEDPMLRTKEPPCAANTIA